MCIILAIYDRFSCLFSVLGFSCLPIKSKTSRSFIFPIAMFFFQFYIDRNLSIAWIGGSDIQVEGVFVWDGTSEGVNRDVKYWFPGQPDDGQGLEDCVVFKYDDVADNYKFNDIPCTANKTFLCEF